MLNIHIIHIVLKVSEGSEYFIIARMQNIT